MHAGSVVLYAYSSTVLPHISELLSYFRPNSDPLRQVQRVIPRIDCYQTLMLVVANLSFVARHNEHGTVAVVAIRVMLQEHYEQTRSLNNGTVQLPLLRQVALAYVV